MFDCIRCGTRNPFGVKTCWHCKFPMPPRVVTTYQEYNNYIMQMRTAGGPSSSEPLRGAGGLRA